MWGIEFKFLVSGIGLRFHQDWPLPSGQGELHSFGRFDPQQFKGVPKYDTGAVD